MPERFAGLSESEQGCSVCERCRAEVLLAEAEFRENGLLETNQKLRQWLSVIESFPSGIVPDRIAIDDIKKIARNALGETTSKQASSPTHRNTR